MSCLYNTIYSGVDFLTLVRRTSSLKYNTMAGISKLLVLLCITRLTILAESTEYPNQPEFEIDIPLNQAEPALSVTLSEHIVGEDRSLVLVDLIGPSYTAQVTIGTKTVSLLVDTGSSDIWVVPDTFRCLDADSLDIERSACGFPGFVESSFSGDLVPHEYLSIIYGNGQFTHGPYGLESVSLGGITVPNQQIALPSEGYIKVVSGDFSGILGLGYPGMVAARKGGEPKPYVNNTDPMTVYDTWFISAVKQNLTAPLFSMALKMDGGGLLAIGGVVDVPIQGDFATTPILIVGSSSLHGMADR